MFAQQSCNGHNMLSMRCANRHKYHQCHDSTLFTSFIWSSIGHQHHRGWEEHMSHETVEYFCPCNHCTRNVKWLEYDSLWFYLSHSTTITCWHIESCAKCSTFCSRHSIFVAGSILCFDQNCAKLHWQRSLLVPMMAWRQQATSISLNEW